MIEKCSDEDKNKGRLAIQPTAETDWYLWCWFGDRTQLCSPNGTVATESEADDWIAGA